MKTFVFTADDNIRFLKELTESGADSLFSHPYPAMYKQLHEKYGLKVQMNLFYEMPGFMLSQMTDRYKADWEASADWLKLSFHSRLENVEPYISSGYQEVYEDCQSVHDEILRFAGEKSLAKTTTIHYCKATEEGIRALRDNGIKGLLGLFGTEGKPSASYSLEEEVCARIRKGEIVREGGMDFCSIDLVMNLYSKEEMLKKLEGLIHRDCLRIMIHEQYFYKDYHAFQPDFEEKIQSAFQLLTRNGYESRFAEEMTGSSGEKPPIS
ncbi:MAG: hypothetical protein IJD86_01970 [Clostridia bacterium]|nr:hypothetical protein [Clostridia bacterium]